MLDAPASVLLAARRFLSPEGLLHPQLVF